MPYFRHPPLRVGTFDRKLAMDRPKNYSRNMAKTLSATHGKSAKVTCLILLNVPQILLHHIKDDLVEVRKSCKIIAVRPCFAEEMSENVTMDGITTAGEV